MISSTKQPKPPGKDNMKVGGNREIWFELNRKFEYGDKYSGGLVVRTGLAASLPHEREKGQTKKNETTNPKLIV